MGVTVRAVVRLHGRSDATSRQGVIMELHDRASRGSPWPSALGALGLIGARPVREPADWASATPVALNTASFTRHCERRLARMVAEVTGLEAWDVADEEAAAAALVDRYRLHEVTVDHHASEVRVERLHPSSVRARLRMPVEGSPELLELAPHPVRLIGVDEGRARGSIELSCEGDLDGPAVREWSSREHTAASRWACLANRAADAFSERLTAVAHHAVTRRRAALDRRSA